MTYLVQTTCYFDAQKQFIFSFLLPLDSIKSDKNQSKTDWVVRRQTCHMVNYNSLSYLLYSQHTTCILCVRQSCIIKKHANGSCLYWLWNCATQHVDAGIGIFAKEISHLVRGDNVFVVFHFHSNYVCNCIISFALAMSIVINVCKMSSLDIS